MEASGEVGACIPGMGRPGRPRAEYSCPRGVTCPAAVPGLLRSAPVFVSHLTPVHLAAHRSSSRSASGLVSPCPGVDVAVPGDPPRCTRGIASHHTGLCLAPGGEASLTPPVFALHHPRGRLEVDQGPPCTGGGSSRTSPASACTKPVLASHLPSRHLAPPETSRDTTPLPRCSTRGRISHHTVVRVYVPSTSRGSGRAIASHLTCDRLAPPSRLRRLTPTRLAPLWVRRCTG